MKITLEEWMEKKIEEFTQEVKIGKQQIKELRKKLKNDESLLSYYKFKKEEVKNGKYTQEELNTNRIKK